MCFKVKMRDIFRNKSRILYFKLFCNNKKIIFKNMKRRVNDIMTFRSLTIATPFEGQGR